jgi:hypothetical protein
MAGPSSSRLLEQVIAQLQLLGGDSLVRSPFLLRGEQSGVQREVDAAVLVGVGASEILLVVEVRDRTRVQGVDWIEQLISKKEDVRADVMVVVSSSGFTESAFRLGARHGLTLWTVRPLAEDQVRELWDFTTDLAEVTAIETASIQPIVRRADLPESTEDTRLMHADGTDDLRIGHLIASLPYDLRSEASKRVDVDRTQLTCLIRLPRTDGYGLRLKIEDANVEVVGMVLDVVDVVPNRYTFRSAWHYVRSDGLEAVYVVRDHPVLGEAPVLKQIRGGRDWRGASLHVIGAPSFSSGTGDSDEILRESIELAGSIVVDKQGRKQYIAFSEWTGENGPQDPELWRQQDLVMLPAWTLHDMKP